MRNVQPGLQARNGDEHRPTAAEDMPPRVEIVLQLLRGEKQLTASAHEQGVDHTTIYRWRDPKLPTAAWINKPTTEEPAH